MEETKLLRVLTFIIINLAVNTSYADQSDMQWANYIAERDQQMVMDNFMASMQDKDFDQDLRESILHPRPVLQIFVSSSMPRGLLKSYAKEASHYDGVLVFCGLPGGSMRKLTNLVMDISDEDHPAAMQIDDAAFAEFGIKIVPSIVLSKPAPMFSKTMVIDKFDKISGNVTIKAALELFASNGDLSSEARRLRK